MIRLNLTHGKPLIFVLLYTAILLSSFSISRSDIFIATPHLIWAVLFDLTLIPCVLFYVLVARPLTLPNLRLTLAVAAIFRIAFYILPTQNNLPHFNWITLLALMEIYIFCAVLFRLAKIVSTFRRVRSSLSFEASLMESFSAVLGSKFAQITLSEFKIIHYSFFGWLVKMDLSPSQTAVTSNKKSAQTAVLVAILLVGIIEAAGLHLLLADWSATASFILTGLSLYSLLFVIAEIVAIHKRPSFSTQDKLHLRLGIRWYAEIDLTEIVSISTVKRKAVKSDSTLNGALLITPNTKISFKKPIKIQGLYLTAKHVTELTLFVDDQKSLIDGWKKKNNL
jgi:hypothetical protein